MVQRLQDKCARSLNTSDGILPTKVQLHMLVQMLVLSPSIWHVVTNPLQNFGSRQLLQPTSMPELIERLEICKDHLVMAGASLCTVQLYCSGASCIGTAFTSHKLVPEQIVHACRLWSQPM